MTWAHDSLPATKTITYAVHNAREKSNDHCAPLVRSCPGRRTKMMIGAPEMTHSRQSTMAPIIPMIHSPKQVTIPARQETMIPISKTPGVGLRKDGEYIGMGPSHLLYDPRASGPVASQMRRFVQRATSPTVGTTEERI